MELDTFNRLRKKRIHSIRPARSLPGSCGGGDFGQLRLRLVQLKRFHLPLEQSGQFRGGFELGSVVVIVGETVVEHETNIGDDLRRIFGKRCARRISDSIARVDIYVDSSTLRQNGRLTER